MITKTTIFGTLLAILALSLGSIATNAYADTTTEPTWEIAVPDTDAIRDPTVTRYLQTIISDDDGVITHEYENYSVTTNVVAASDSTYLVNTKVYENDQLIETLIYSVTDDSASNELTINVSGTETTFTTTDSNGGISTEAIYPGYYLTTVDLQTASIYIPSNGSFNFSASDGAGWANYNVFGVVFGYNGYANFTWDVANYYLYYGFIPQFLQLGVVNYNDNSSYGTSLGAGDTTGYWTSYVSTPGTYFLHGTFNYVLP